MKRLILLSTVLCLTTGAALATPIGFRAGVTFDPGQFHIGAHGDLGPVIESLRLVPNIEVGFGDDLTLIALNGDLIYDFPSTPWAVGGELGFNFINYDTNVPGFDSSTTDLGLSALGNYRYRMDSGKTLTLEAKLGLLDSPDLKFTVGWYF